MVFFKFIFILFKIYIYYLLYIHIFIKYIYKYTLIDKLIFVKSINSSSEVYIHREGH